MDAVCINQEDNTEKDYQVGLMRDIYLRAEKIVVWLGDNGKDARVALEFCRELKEYPRFSGKGRMDIAEKVVKGTDPSLEENPSSSTERQILEKIRQNSLLEPEYHSTSWAACKELLSSPWFSRSWVIQEILHANQAVAVIGDLQLPLDELCTGLQTYISMHTVLEAKRIRRLYVSGTQLLSGEPMDIANEDGTVNDENAIKAFELSKKFSVPTPPGIWDMWFRSEHSAFNITRIISERRAQYREEPEKARPRLINLMLDFRAQGATDPRDKIWAFWSMADPEYPISPNYKADTKGSVYVKMARHFVKKSLAVLFLTECPQRTIMLGKEVGVREKQILPSWVPDWSQTQTLVARAMFMHHAEFRAGEGFPKLHEHHVEPRFAINEVPEILTIRGVYVAVVTATFRAHVTRDLTLGVEDAVTLFTHDRDSSLRHGPFVKSGWPNGDSSVSFVNTSWGPYHTEVGDIIVVAPGSNLPLVLRRQESRYLFVGACWFVKERIHDVNCLKDDRGFDEVMFGSVCEEEGVESRVEIFQLY